MIKLFVGLGNPGAEYEDTRHNAGFWFIDQLAQQLKVQLQPEKNYHGWVARTTLQGETIWLLKPATFMNLSGKSVAALARFYKIAPEQMLVAHDELDLTPGEAKLKLGGGHAGHNGLRFDDRDPADAVGVDGDDSDQQDGRPDRFGADAVFRSVQGRVGEEPRDA